MCVRLYSFDMWLSISCPGMWCIALLDIAHCKFVVAVVAVGELLNLCNSTFVVLATATHAQQGCCSWTGDKIGPFQHRKASLRI